VRPWQVVCVCDPDDAAAGFAVTRGLTTLGLPELLLPARPPWQEVEAGWRLSHRDLASLLDDLGEQLLCGDLWGYGFEAELEGPLEGRFEGPLEGRLEGRATARLVPAAPVPVEALDETLPAVLPGLRATAGPSGAAVARLVEDLVRTEDDGAAAVCVVPWALDGGAVALAAILAAGAGPAPGLLAAEVASVQARTAALRGEILERGGRPGHVPGRWRPAPGRLPARPRPAAAGGERFGPRHALVVARAEQLLLSDPALLTAFLELAVELGGEPPRQVLERLEGLTSSSGRGGVPAELALAANDVATLLTGRGGHTARWRQACSALQRRHRPDRAAFEEGARARLHEHVHALLAAEAFSDVLPPSVLLCGRLSWAGALVALGPQERWPG
jgi:hypothetical protein